MILKTFKQVGVWLGAIVTIISLVVGTLAFFDSRYVAADDGKRADEVLVRIEGQQREIIQRLSRIEGKLEER